MSEDLAPWLLAVLEDSARGLRDLVTSYRGLDPEGRAEADAGDRWRAAVLALADLETQGRLVELHRGGHECRTEHAAIGAAEPLSEWTRWVNEWTDGPCLTLRLLAAPFWRWPGWREEWSA